MIDQRNSALRVVAIESWRDRKADHIFSSETEIHVAQVPQRTNKQRRSCEKQRSESDLSRNQQLSKAHMGSAGRGCRSLILDRLRDRRPRNPKRGNDSKE